MSDQSEGQRAEVTTPREGHSEVPAPAQEPEAPATDEAPEDAPEDEETASVDPLTAGAEPEFGSQV